MDVRVEEAGPCKKRITIEVPPEEVKSKFDESYENLRKNLELPGFRRGHVPRSLMERRFGEDVAKDVRRDLLQETYQKAVSDNDLEVVGTPDFKEDELQELTPEQPFTYTLDVEVKPVFDLPDYSQLRLEKPPVEPTEAELQHRVNLYRHRMATFETKEGPAEAEDLLDMDLEMRVGDEVILKRQHYRREAGAHHILGLRIENLASELTGAAAGDEKTFTVAIPEDFPLKQHRGKDCSMSLKINEVRRLVLPEPTDEWAQEMGFDSLDELKDEFRTQVRRIKEEGARESLKRQIRDQLAEMVHMEMPEDLVNRVLEQDRARMRMWLEQQAQQDDELKEHLEEEIAKATAEAEKEGVRNVKLYFILDEIAKREKVLVTEDELRARSDQLAAAYRADADVFWESISSDGRLASLRRDMTDEKVFDLLISKATVSEAAPAEEEAEKTQEEGKATE